MTTKPSGVCFRCLVIDPPAEIVDLLDARIGAFEEGHLAAQPVAVFAELGLERRWIQNQKLEDHPPSPDVSKSTVPTARHDGLYHMYSSIEGSIRPRHYRAVCSRPVNAPPTAHGRLT